MSGSSWAFYISWKKSISQRGLSLILTWKFINSESSQWVNPNTHTLVTNSKVKLTQIDILPIKTKDKYSHIYAYILLGGCQRVRGGNGRAKVTQTSCNYLLTSSYDWKGDNTHHTHFYIHFWNPHPHYITWKKLVFLHTFSFISLSSGCHVYFMLVWDKDVRIIMVFVKKKKVK